MKISNVCGLSSMYAGPTRMNDYDQFRFSRRRHPACEVEGLECSRMDNDHWKVPPYWTREYCHLFIQSITVTMSNNAKRQKDSTDDTLAH